MTDGGRPGPITLRELAAGVRDDLLQWDRGILGTFIGLLWRPGRVIRAFIYDRDIRYTPPWRYLLFGVVTNVAATWFVLDNLGFRERLGVPQNTSQISFLLDNAALLTLAVLPLVALAMRFLYIGLQVRYIDALIALFYTQGQVNLFGVLSLVLLALMGSTQANTPIAMAVLIYLLWSWSSFAHGPWWRRLLAAVLTLVAGQAINALVVIGAMRIFA